MNECSDNDEVLCNINRQPWDTQRANQTTMRKVLHAHDKLLVVVLLLFVRRRKRRRFGLHAHGRWRLWLWHEWLALVSRIHVWIGHALGAALLHMEH